MAGTSDPEIYRHGVYGPDFTAYFTVAPAGTYRARLHFCQAEQPPQPGGYATTIDIQGKEVVADMDIAAKAGGLARPSLWSSAASGLATASLPSVSVVVPGKLP